MLRNLSLLCCILLCTVGLLAQSKMMPRANWHISQVDGEDYVDYVGKYTAIALDANDYPHISYQDVRNLSLKYAKWNGTDWEIETVDTDSNVAHHTSIALDSNGFPHIAYGRMNSWDDKDLKYAYWNGTEWTIEVVDDQDNTGGRCTIALDQSNRPHIAYCSRIGYDPGKIRYASWDGTQWVIEDAVATTTAQGSAMDMDSQDHPHIVYYDSAESALKYTTWNGTAWVAQTITTGNSYLALEIDLDSLDRPHISFINSNANQMSYAKWNGLTWVVQVVEQGESGISSFYEKTSIAVDANDRPHVSYWEDVRRDLHYAYFDGTQWQVQRVDHWGKVGSFNSIAIDSQNYPHIAYHYALEGGGGGEKEDESDRAYYGSLKYAYVSDEPVITKGWKTDVVDDPGIRMYAGRFGSMLLDQYDCAHIVYNEIYRESEPDKSRQDIVRMKYARRTTHGEWKYAIIDDQYGITGQSSIAMDSTRKLHVTYGVINGEVPNKGKGSRQGSLVYATGVYTRWTITNIDDVACGNTSIAIDSNDRPHIAYCDEWNRCVKYAYWDGSEWFIDYVDGVETSAVGGALSIAVDGYNRPHISYHDIDNYTLKYAVWQEPTKGWDITTVDEDYASGAYTSIRLDSQGYPHIAYAGPEYSESSCELKYAYFDGEVWQLQIIDDSARMAGTTSLFLDINGTAYISYYDWDHQNLKYAHRVPDPAKAWESEVVDKAGYVGQYSSLALDRRGYPHISFMYQENSNINAILKYTYYSDNWNAITLKLLDVQKAEIGVAVKWETATEINNAGFYVWRCDSENGEYTRLHDAIIPSEGEGNVGAKYSYNDVTARIGNTYYYKLEDLDYQGKGTMHGPVKVTLTQE